MKERKEISDRAFWGFVLVLLAAAGMAPLIHGRPIRIWPFAVFLGILTAAVLAPKWLRPIKRLWLDAMAVVGRIANFVLLSIPFFLMFTPVGWIRRCFGSDVLNLRRSGDVDTYWIERGKEPGSMRLQF
jgi:hypothetical protein